MRHMASIYSADRIVHCCVYTMTRHYHDTKSDVMIVFSSSTEHLLYCHIYTVFVIISYAVQHLAPQFFVMLIVFGS